MPTRPSLSRPHRDKVFGLVRGMPLDRNAKARIRVWLEGYNARHRQPGQHRGPITRAYMEVLQALLWGFHNSRTGCCFPSYEAIAAKARCCRDTVYEAIKALEAAGILTWVNRLVRQQVRERDLFGRWATRRRVLRTSNAYLFRDPLPGHAWPRREGRGVAAGASRSENPTGTLNQDISTPKTAPDTRAEGFGGMGDALLKTLHRLGCAIAERDGLIMT